MKKLFALTLLAIVFSQSSTLAGCYDDLDISVKNWKSGKDQKVLINGKLNVTNRSKNKIILKHLNLLVRKTDSDDSVKYSITVNKTIDPYGKIEKNFRLEPYPEFKGKNYKKVSSSLSCVYQKERNTKIIVGIGFVLLILFFVYLNRTLRKKDIIEYNKTHTSKIKTYAELEKIREEEKISRLHKQWDKEKKEELREEAEIKKRVKKIEKEEEKEEKKKRLQEEKRLPREERRTEKEPSGSDLISRLKRLKKMYNDGNLNKAEFEKAKNKLLK